MKTIQPINSFKLIPRKVPRATALAGLMAVFLAIPQLVQAQLGSNWTQYSPTKKIHLGGSSGLSIYNLSSYQSEDTPISGDYSYDSSTDTETFRRLDNRSTRSEIRLFNDYTTGERQFQGYVTFVTPINDQSLMQIFGSTSGATLAMTRGYPSQGGNIYITTTGGTVWGNRTIATGCYGVEKRINVIHSQDKYVQWYVNGTLKCQQGDTEVGVMNYHKYGCYGSFSGVATVKWRQVRSYRDGSTSKVRLYAATSYGGASGEFVCGSFTKANLISAGLADNVASSIKVPAGYQVTLYTEDNFTGTSIVRTADDSSLVADGFNDQVSSLKIITTNN